MSNERITIGEEYVTVRTSGGGTKKAKILDRERDAAGEVVRIVLDRIIHQTYSQPFSEDDTDAYVRWAPRGCFATELVRE